LHHLINESYENEDKERKSFAYLIYIAGGALMSKEGHKEFQEFLGKEEGDDL